MAAGDFVKAVGSATLVNTSTSDPLVITVPAGGVAAGNTIFLVVGSRSGTTVSATDDGGNTYTVDVSRIDDGSFAAVVRGAISTVLAENDQIAVTLTGVSATGHARVVTATEYEGVATLDQAAESASATTTPASGPVTTTSAPQTLVGGLYARGFDAESMDADAPWVERIRATQDASVVGQSTRILQADRNVASVDTFEFTATVNPSRHTIASIATYEFTAAGEAFTSGSEVVQATVGVIPGASGAGVVVASGQAVGEAPVGFDPPGLVATVDGSDVHLTWGEEFLVDALVTETV